jgi:hypothetical protein
VIRIPFHGSSSGDSLLNIYLTSENTSYDYDYDYDLTDSSVVQDRLKESSKGPVPEMHQVSTSPPVGNTNIPTQYSPHFNYPCKYSLTS